MAAVSTTGYTRPCGPEKDSPQSESMVVRGQYRTSVIVDPVDGRMPLTPAGLELAE